MTLPIWCEAFSALLTVCWAAKCLWTPGNGGRWCCCMRAHLSLLSSPVRGKVAGQAMTSKRKESFLFLVISLYPEGEKGSCYWRNNRILGERRGRASIRYKLVYFKEEDSMFGQGYTPSTPDLPDMLGDILKFPRQLPSSCRLPVLLDSSISSLGTASIVLSTGRRGGIWKRKARFPAGRKQAADMVAVARLATYTLRVLGTVNGDAFAPICSKKLHPLQTLGTCIHWPKGILLHGRLFQKGQAARQQRRGGMLTKKIILIGSRTVRYMSC